MLCSFVLPQLPIEAAFRFSGTALSTGLFSGGVAGRNCQRLPALLSCYIITCRQLVASSLYEEFKAHPEKCEAVFK
ncbi:hypothetical protein CEV33_0946 [Brucella grignonensis]|uniref:Uncharacterized protein n=1 Tax=Brucella grignonensis TaxID=94627 RepID=A0A256FEC7_9HYPH|nr:hypothetical protein CEV33_0946 [Brucella grignonensis]